jgi:hypothetical protein
MLEKYDKYGLIVYFEFHSLLTTRGGEKGGIIRSIRSIRAKFKFFSREAGKTRLLGAGDLPAVDKAHVASSTER